MLRSIGLPELLVILIVAGGLMGVFYVIPLWRIFERSGRPGALALIALFPGAAVVLLWVIAFIDWPSLRTRQTNL